MIDIYNYILEAKLTSPEIEAAEKAVRKARMKMYAARKSGKNVEDAEAAFNDAQAKYKAIRAAAKGALQDTPKNTEPIINEPKPKAEPKSTKKSGLLGNAPNDIDSESLPFELSQSLEKAIAKYPAASLMYSDGFSMKGKDELVITGDGIIDEDTTDLILRSGVKKITIASFTKGTVKIHCKSDITSKIFDINWYTDIVFINNSPVKIDKCVFDLNYHNFSIYSEEFKYADVILTNNTFNGIPGDEFTIGTRGDMSDWQNNKVKGCKCRISSHMISNNVELGAALQKEAKAFNKTKSLPSVDELINVLTPDNDALIYFDAIGSDRYHLKYGNVKALEYPYWPVRHENVAQVNGYDVCICAGKRKSKDMLPDSNPASEDGTNQEYTIKKDALKTKMNPKGNYSGVFCIAKQVDAKAHKYFMDKFKEFVKAKKGSTAAFIEPDVLKEWFGHREPGIDGDANWLEIDIRPKTRIYSKLGQYKGPTIYIFNGKSDMRFKTFKTDDGYYMSLIETTGIWNGEKDLL